MFIATRHRTGVAINIIIKRKKKINKEIKFKLNSQEHMFACSLTWRGITNMRT